MKLPVTTLLCLCTMYFVHAQKRVLSYPFEFDKSFLERSDYDAYFLDNQIDSTFSIILKDNKKVEYALLDKKFKVISKIPSAINASFFNESAYNYAGGTTSGNQYHFVYSVKHSFQMETVDFDKKQLSHQTIFDIPKTEKALTSFSANNTFFAITTNDKTSELNFYVVDSKGNPSQKTIPFKLPPDLGKQRDKLSTYFSNLTVIKNEEEPDLSNSVVDAKLFTYGDRLEFVINDKDNPTQIFTVHLPDLRADEKFISYDGIVPPNEKGNIYISSFEKNGKLVSLVLNKKNIRIAIHDLKTSSLLTKYEINDDADANLFAQSPITERRLGKREDAKDVNDVKKLIKALSKGTEGVMITENKNGQWVLTIGTYDLIPTSTGGSSGGYAGGWEQKAAPTTPSITNHGATMTSMSVWNPTKYYVPGTPSYTTTSARYYSTTYFKMLLDPNTLKIARGKVPQPVADQIKDYIETIDKKAKATNQFSIGKNQYYGYYDRDSKSYLIDQIRIYQ